MLLQKHFVILHLLVEFAMFEKIVRKLNVSVIDTPIYIDACGNDVYIHLMSREIHADIAEIISKDIHQGFDK